MMKNLLVVLVSALVLLTSACNTFKGIGQDVKKGGEKIEKAAS